MADTEIENFDNKNDYHDEEVIDKKIHKTSTQKWIRWDRYNGRKSKTECVIALIKEGRYVEAAKFGDERFKTSVKFDHEYWWDAALKVTSVNKDEWDSRCYGNIAVGIAYGIHFAERKPEIERLKEMFLRDL